MSDRTYAVQVSPAQFDALQKIGTLNPMAPDKLARERAILDGVFGSAQVDSLIALNRPIALEVISDA